MKRLTLPLLLLACAPKVDPTAPRPMPDPLPASPWLMPASQTATLSNGVQVVAVTNREVPLWELRLWLPTGSPDDPAGAEGLLETTFDMMNEGAAGKTASELSRAQQLLGGSVSSGAGRDSAMVAVGGPRRNLEPLLDIWADVVLRPDFPAQDWTLLQDRLVADLKLDAERPTSIAGRVVRKLTWGAQYAGREATEGTYRAITTAQQHEAWQRAVIPDGAVILVGGDLSIDEIVPLLEARLSGWKPTGKAPARPRPTPKEPGAAALYLIDKPGAAQSVLSTVLPMLTPTDPAHYALHMGNTVLGGAFTARINMNLREDKGYTYGARCGLELTRGPEIWSCSASVATNVTAPAFKELRREIEEVLTARPIKDEEISFFRSYRVNSFQGSYETPTSLLDEIVRIRALDLPSDWLERYVPGVEAVGADAANAALQQWLRADRISYVIVGDRARFASELADIGLPIVELDRDGNLLEK